MKAQNFRFTKPKIKKESVEGGAILNYSEKGSAKWPPGLLNTIIPSSAFCNHSTNFFIWSRKTLLPFIQVMVEVTVIDSIDYRMREEKAKDWRLKSKSGLKRYTQN